MIASIDWGKLGELVWAAALAGVAVVICFAVLILGATRAAELRRAERAPASTAFAVLTVVATIAFFGAVAFGVTVITSK